MRIVFVCLLLNYFKLIIPLFISDSLFSISFRLIKLRLLLISLIFLKFSFKVNKKSCELFSFLFGFYNILISITIEIIVKISNSKYFCKFNIFKVTIKKLV